MNDFPDCKDVRIIEEKNSGKERENIWKADTSAWCKLSQDACHTKWFFISCLFIKLIGLYILRSVRSWSF